MTSRSSIVSRAPLPGPDGTASHYPHSLSVGESATVILGIANHEHRQVHYFVQVWLVNASFVDNETIIHAMYFFDEFDVVLNHTGVNLEGPWTPQWQTYYSFSVPIAGEFKLWFFLFQDSVPSYAQDLIVMQDYAGGPTDQLFYDAVENKAGMLSLNLNLDVKYPVPPGIN